MTSKLGLAFAAGKLIVGADQTVKAIQTGKAKMIILANDASYNTTKRITDKATYYKVPINNSFTTEQISKAIGKYNIKALAITEKGFANMYK